MQQEQQQEPTCSPSDRLTDSQLSVMETDGSQQAAPASLPGGPNKAAGPCSRLVGRSSWASLQRAIEAAASPANEVGKARTRATIAF